MRGHFFSALCILTEDIRVERNFGLVPGGRLHLEREFSVRVQEAADPEDLRHDHSSRVPQRVGRPGQEVCRIRLHRGQIPLLRRPTLLRPNLMRPLEASENPKTLSPPILF